MPNENRPPIPDPIKREVRQEAGFGCCYCGHPFYEYHHIVPWSECREHAADNLMTVCPNCHDRLTRSTVNRDEQFAKKASPKNLSDGHPRGLLDITQPDLAMRFGGNLLRRVRCPLQVNTKDLFAIRKNDAGAVELSSKIYDATGDVLGEISANEWSFSNRLPWDMEASYQRILVRQAQRQISLEIDCRQAPMKIRAQLWIDGFHIRVNENETIYEGNGISGSIGGMDVENCDVGMAFTIGPPRDRNPRR
ncbi:MAG: HNH endonuclease [Pirellulaceae bacterium]